MERGTVVDMPELLANKADRLRAVVREISILCILLGSAAIASADILHLSDGRQLEGEIVSETDEGIALRMPIGATVHFSRDEIDRIERKESVFDVYEDRLGKLSEDDAEGYFALGQWCVKNGLRKEGKEAYNKVIEIDPNHEGAREALGFVRHEGKWLSYKEQMQARGLVFFRGKWIAPAERDELQEAYQEQKANEKLQRRVRRLLSHAAIGTPKQRVKAQDELLALTDPAAIGPLIRALDERLAIKRSLAVRALAGIKDPRAVAGLLLATLYDEKSEIRHAAARALRDVGDPEVVPKLTARLDSASGRVRESAAEALGILGDRRAIGSLLDHIVVLRRVRRNVPSGIIVGSGSAYVYDYDAIVTSGAVAFDPVIGYTGSSFGISWGGVETEVMWVVNWPAVEALSAITGKRFGDNINGWMDWWDENRHTLEGEEAEQEKQ